MGIIILSFSIIYSRCLIGFAVFNSLIDHQYLLRHVDSIANEHNQSIFLCIRLVFRFEWINKMI